MEQNRCSLCEGRIVDGRCRDCGMHYPKERKELQTAEEKTQSKPKKQTEEEIEKKKKNLSIFFILVFVVIVAAVILEFVGKNQKQMEEMAMTLEAVEGSGTEIFLESGEYVAGRHIPEGTYQVSAVYETDGMAFFSVFDERGEEIEYWDIILEIDWDQEDLPENEEIFMSRTVTLSRGDTLSVQGNQPLRFVSEDASPESVEKGMDNPLTEEVPVKEIGIMTAGKDFAAGIYDVVISSGEAQFYYEKGESGQQVIYLDSGELFGTSVYRNLNLEEAADVRIEPIGEEFCKITLIPSEVIYRN